MKSYAGAVSRFPLGISLLATLVPVCAASYQSQSEVSGSVLRYSREYVVRDLHVSPDRLADFRKFEGLIGSDEMASAVLVHQP